MVIAGDEVVQPCRTFYMPKGQVKIESKDKMRKCGLPSLDLADASAVCYAPPWYCAALETPNPLPHLEFLSFGGKRGKALYPGIDTLSEGRLDLPKDYVSSIPKE